MHSCRKGLSTALKKKYLKKLLYRRALKINAVNKDTGYSIKQKQSKGQNIHLLGPDDGSGDWGKISNPGHPVGLAVGVLNLELLVKSLDVILELKKSYRQATQGCVDSKLAPDNRSF